MGAETSPITVGSMGSSHSCWGGGGFFPHSEYCLLFTECLDNGKVIDEIRHM